MLPISAQTPVQLEPEVGSPPTNEKNVHKLTMSSLNHYSKTSHYPLRRTRGFEGISLLWPPLAGKSIAILFYFIQICLQKLIQCGGRGWNQLQEGSYSSIGRSPDFDQRRFHLQEQVCSVQGERRKKGPTGPQGTLPLCLNVKHNCFCSF